MAQRACEKCGEMADEAKAFCPACGHNFIEEQKREQPSEFQSMDGTMQMGKTMYNQMLSDMGLNLNAVPRPTAPSPIVQALPAEPARRPDPVPSEAAAPETQKGGNKFLIFGIIAAFLILGALIVIAAAIVLWMRFG